MCTFVAATTVSAVSYSQTLEKFSLKSLRSVLFPFGKLRLMVSCCCNQEFIRYFRRNGNLETLCAVCLSSLPAMSVLIVERAILEFEQIYLEISSCLANVTSQVNET